jgi:hypothetical protein
VLHRYKCLLYNHNQVRLSDVGKRAVLSVDDKKDVCVYKEQNSGVSQ